jgi:D-glycero-alpha-D-manno-heptose-7-phosphate kinase
LEIYRAKSPLRVSFVGGGTDIEPYLDDFGGCVLSTTINKYCYATLIPRADNQVIIHSHDFNLTVKYQLENKDQLEDDLRLVRAVIKRFDVSQGFEIRIHSDAPVGSGLGSSSSLVVCLIGLFSKWLNLSLSLYDISKMAYEIERIDLGINGGHQDQYASTFGGFNFIEFYKDKKVVNPLRIKNDILNELEYNLLLCFTGKTRMGENIIKKQVSGYKENVKYLHELKSLTHDMKNALLTGDLNEFGSLFNDAWENKKKLTNSISNPHIDNLCEIGREAGGFPKLLGAGGGGYLLFYCKDKQKVGKALQDAGGEIVDFNFDYEGLRAWKI